MKISDLPIGDNPEAIETPHFPSKFQTVIWRNWELVPLLNLAKVLHASEEDILEAASLMGLRTPPKTVDKWISLGYNTIIRANWHLLPYEQLLEILDWSVEHLDNVLKEEDFLWLKLGQLKPKTNPVYYYPLSQEEVAKTKIIKNLVNRHFPDIMFEETEDPFGFIKNYKKYSCLEKSTHDMHNIPDICLAYSYSALYGDALIDPKLDPYPDTLLEELAANGINAIWLQGVLYNLYPWQDAPELSEEAEIRIKNLNQLIERTKKYGIKVYLYLNEPRGPSVNFFERHPELKEKYLGIEYIIRNATTMCTSKDTVKKYLRAAVTWVFQKAPELAGAFLITMSENPTHCYSKTDGLETQCKVCAERQPEKIVAEVNNIIAEAIHAVNPKAKTIAWTWGWAQNNDWCIKTIDLLSEKLILMCTSEDAMPIEIGGIKNNIGDYSISQVGPGPRSLALWEHAKSRGLKTMAKVQLSNSWECASIPYIPATNLVEQHLNNLRKLDFDGIMTSWTLGGYPSLNQELLVKSFEKMIRERFGSKAAANVKQSLTIFSEAFQEFPFNHGTLYFSPHNVGPGNLLYEKATGYRATMVGFPYDDLERFRINYPEDVFEEQLKKLSEKWREGLDILNGGKDGVDIEYLNNYNDLERIATAAYCHFRSSYLQVAFIRLRDRSFESAPIRIIDILCEEISLAKKLIKIVREDSRVGFEATNHYVYYLGSLREKVINCEYLKERFL